MGFYISNEENRQHISLSGEAIRIIEFDIVSFKYDVGKKNISGFLNIIFKNYYDSFPLSSSVVLKNINKIRARLRNDRLEKNIIESISKELSEEFMRDSINEYANKYSDEFKYKFKFNNENAQILKEIEIAKYFEQNAPRSGLGFFLKIIFESYSRLRRVEREKIFFKERFEIIEKCIDKGKKLKIKEAKKETFYVKPLLVNNQNKEHRNLLLYSVENDEGIYYDFVNIAKVQISETNLPSKYLDQQYQGSDKDFAGLILNEINKSINKSSVMPRIDVLVKFTPGGLERYFKEEDDIPFRGTELDDDHLLFKFNASESEMFYYLFKYGAQVEIIKPIELREKFKRFYQISYEVYNKKGDYKNEIERVV